jgi:hypothetical protein
MQVRAWLDRANDELLQQLLGFLQRRSISHAAAVNNTKVSTCVLTMWSHDTQPTNVEPRHKQLPPCL